MRKIYSALIAGLCIAGLATAGNALLNVDKAQLKTRAQKVLKSEAKPQKFQKSATELSAAKSGKKVMSIRKADGNPSIEGLWTFSLGDYYFQSSVNSTITVDFEATLQGTTLTFTDPTGYELPMVANYSSTASTVTFSKQYLGTASGYYIYQEPFAYNYGTQNLDPITLVGRYNSTAGTISFTSDQGISWAAYTNQAATNQAGYFGIYDLEGATKAAETGGGDDDSDQWEDAGEATLIDGWVLPAFGIDQMDEENWFKVPLQKSTTNENLYRLVDPYHQTTFPAVSANASNTVGYIVFDATDPDHVVVNPNKVEAGFANSSAGITKFYCYNTLGYLMAEYGYSAETIIGIMEDDMPYTTFKDGVLHLGFIENEEGKIEYDANFGIQSAPTGGYVWTGSDMTAYVLLEGASLPTEGEEIPEGAYVVYADGQIGQGLEANGWYNEVYNFNAANPKGSGVVYEMKTGGASNTAASMGLMTSNKDVVGQLHSADLHLNYYATVPGKYTIRLTGGGDYDYDIQVTADMVNKWTPVSFNVAEEFPTLSTTWDEADYVGNVFPFAIVITADANDTGAAIYFDKIYYTNLDTEWEAPVVTIPAPETVPAPQVEGKDYFSFYSSLGTVSYGIGGWGQSTQVENQTIDGQPVMFLAAFNYLGLDNFDINISEYDYMHIDYWTSATEGVSFGFVPISLEPTKDTPIWEAQEIKANEWNSYDAPLSGFDADMSSIEQIKLVANLNGTTSTQYAYIANVYFWKEAEGGEPGDVINGIMTAQLDMSQGMGDPELIEPEEFDITATYDADTKKLTFNKLAEAENPIVFTVNPAENTAVAAFGQLAYTEDGFDYYYRGLESADGSITASIYNTEDGKCVLELEPYGEAADFTAFEMGWWFNFAYYNGVITLDEAIPGLGEETAPASIEIGPMVANSEDNTTGGVTLTVTVPVTYENLGDNPEIEVAYTWAEGSEPASENTDNAGTTVAKNADGEYVITIGGLKFNTTYTIQVTASAGTKASDTKTITYTTIASEGAGVDVIGVDDADAVYYDLNGRRVVNPDKGIYIKVVSGKAVKEVIK